MADYLKEQCPYCRYSEAFTENILICTNKKHLDRIRPLWKEPKRKFKAGLRKPCVEFEERTDERPVNDETPAP